MTKRYRRTEEEWDDMDDGYRAPKRRLRRNKIDGILGGVCAGIGDYFDIDPIIARILFVISVMIFGLPLFVYFILWIFIPSDKRAPYRREYRQARRAKRENPTRPAQTSTFRDVKGKFRSLEGRLQDLEKSITSSEWQLRREFRDLEG